MRYRMAARAWFPDRHTAERLLKQALATDYEWAHVDSYTQKLMELQKQLNTQEKTTHAVSPSVD
jgi:hypothetical protein